MAKSIIKKSQIQVYFENLKKSNEIVALQDSIKDLAIKVNDTSPQDQGDLKKDFTRLKKEIEKEKNVINEPLNEIKTENQAIFKPLLDGLVALKKASEDSYAAWYRAEELRRKKYQEELDRKAAEERKKQELEAKKAKEKGETILPIVPIEAPKVAPPVLNKQMLRKSINIDFVDKLAFIEHAIETNDQELLDCIEITKKTGIDAKARRNPGRVNIPGVNIIYLPTLEAWEK